jgi:hypothetical protein
MAEVIWKIGLAAIAMTALGMPAGAALQSGRDAARYVDGGGKGWTLRENRHGAVLRRRGTEIYLGRACDARSPQLGRGRWGWANGGFLITFPRRHIGFPRQDPPISDLTDSQCRM